MRIPEKLKKIGKWSGTSLLLLTTSALTYVRINQMSLFIHGAPFSNSDDAEDIKTRNEFLGNPRYQTLDCRVDGIGNLSVPYYPATQGKGEKVVLFWHGSADAPETAWPRELIKEFPKDTALIFMRYPNGNPTPGDINRAATTVLEIYEKKHAVKVMNIDEIGNSLGSAPAIELADGDPRVKRIAVINPFANLKDQLLIEPMAHYVVWLFNDKYNWDVIKLSAQLKPDQELTIFSSGSDERVPPIDKVDIFNAAARKRTAATNTRLIMTPGERHDDPLATDARELIGNLRGIGFFGPPQ